MVRRVLLEELLEYPEWSRRLDEAESFEEMEKVLAEFCKSRGYKVVKK